MEKIMSAPWWLPLKTENTTSERESRGPRSRTTTRPWPWTERRMATRLTPCSPWPPPTTCPKTPVNRKLVQNFSEFKLLSSLDLTANLQVVVQKDEGVVDKNGGPTVTSSLLNPAVDVKESNKRYETSELHQFWIILKRALLFSRRDWVSLNAQHYLH